MIRPDYLTRCLRERLRLWCTLGSHSAWLLPVHYHAEREAFRAVRSTADRSEILEITTGFLRHRKVQQLELEPVAVEPLVLAGNHPIHARQHGHNGANALFRHAAGALRVEVEAEGVGAESHRPACVADVRNAADLDLDHGSRTGPAAR